MSGILSSLVKIFPPELATLYPVDREQANHFRAVFALAPEPLLFSKLPIKTSQLFQPNRRTHWGRWLLLQRHASYLPFSRANLPILELLNPS